MTASDPTGAAPAAPDPMRTSTDSWTTAPGPSPDTPVPARPPSPVTASIVIPTRARPAYLEIALASIASQAQVAGAEILVIDDAGSSDERRAQAQRLGARYEPHPSPLGLNVARNTGIERSRGEIVVFVDDDVEAHAGWLAALLAAAREHPDVDVFTGPIRPRLEGRHPHGCGREGPPITALDLGARDTDAGNAWGANMAIRRAALQRIGPFDAALEHGGDEQEWQERLRAREPGARVLYVAGAAVDHRRAGRDARLRALARGQYARGRAARRFDAWRGQAPSLGRELNTLAGCAGHVVRRRCPAGLTMVAHSAGRVREAVRHPTAGGATFILPATVSVASADPSAVAPTGTAIADDFLSGESGTVGGLDGLRRDLLDAATDAWELASVRRMRLNRAARRTPPRRRVLAIGVVRPEHATRARKIEAELLCSRHAVELYTCPPGKYGKFENLNRLLAEHPATGNDWLLTIDDDVELPRGFLDDFVFLSERFGLRLAQPAHRANSHAAWRVTRRRLGSVARETRFVEIGPVTAFAAETFAELLPFPDVEMGWGLDAHWAALARARAWRCGVIDAVAIAHRVAPAADAYSRETAIAEARAFLADRPYVRAQELRQTLTTYRRW